MVIGKKMSRNYYLKNLLASLKGSLSGLTTIGAHTYGLKPLLANLNTATGYSFHKIGKLLNSSYGVIEGWATRGYGRTTLVAKLIEEVESLIDRIKLRLAIDNLEPSGNKTNCTAEFISCLQKITGHNQTELAEVGECSQTLIKRWIELDSGRTEYLTPILNFAEPLAYQPVEN